LTSTIDESAEQRRVDALLSYEILDSPDEEEYGNIVALAASILGVPDAYVTLLDKDRQWIKAALDASVRGTGPLELSFCRHMIQTREPLIVEDASVHEIFKDYANVTGVPYIRFYAGVPLEAPEGEVLGALCVTDSKPRHINEEQMRALSILARQVQSQMELRRTTIQLHKALVAAQDARKSRDLFFASISHDIRTPAAAIVGASQILNTERLPEAAHKLVEGIESHGKVLTLLLNNLLDLAKMDAGKFELAESPFDLSALVREMVDGHLPIARSKGIDLVADYDPELGKTFIGDSLRIRQIIGNLLSNAIKFTGNGSVRISAKKRGRGVRLSVADSGIGIPPERIATILNEYEQAESTTHQRYGGTGLGLSIVSRLTALMNGDLSITSEPGKGSEFTVEIPLKPVQVSGLTLDLKRALIVDDNAVNQMVIEAQVAQLGIPADLAGTAAEARVLFEQNIYDLILLDERLPDGKGTELAAEIRASNTSSEAVLLGISAAVEDEQRHAFEKAGMNGHLAKPFTADQLAMAIRSTRPH